MAEIKEHYTAILEVVKTTQPVNPPTNRGFPVIKDDSDKKQTTQVVKLVVRASSLSRLIEKLGNHVELIEDEEEE